MRTRELLFGVGIGAALAFLADPAGGRGRRAKMRDQLVHASRKTRHSFDAATRDITTRTAGIVAAARRRWTDANVDDGRLRERVRSRLGRASSHPRAIDIDVNDGVVILRGPVLATELENLIDTIGAVPGVRSVANELRPHYSAEGVPELQGDARARNRSGLRRNWTPATQAAVTAAGLAATVVCVAAYGRR